MKSAIKLLLMFSGAIAPPPAVTNLAVTGASGGVVADLTPELTWDAVAGADTYTLQYDTDSGFGSATEVTGIATTSYTHPSDLANFTTYYWRVAGVNSAGQGAWSSSVSAQTWITVFLDLFNTDDAAPLTDPLPTSPAGYNWDVYDTGSKASIASSLLGWGSSTGNANPNLVGQTNLDSLLPFPAGAIAFKWRSGGGWTEVGYVNNTDASAGLGARLFPPFDINSGNIALSGRTGNVITYATDNTEYWSVLAHRSSGVHAYIKGGAFTDWTLIFTVPNQASLTGATTMVPFISAIGTTSDIDFDAVVAGVLDAPFATDTGLATVYNATSTADDTITTEADSLTEWWLTAATGVTQELSVRRTDDNNRLIIRCDQAGSTLKIIKVDGGGETELASVARAWANGTVYRVTARCSGSKLYAQAATGSQLDTQSNTSATDSFNSSATGAKVSHNGGVFASWPLVNAAASAQLNALVAGAGN